VARQWEWQGARGAVAVGIGVAAVGTLLEAASVLEKGSTVSRMIGNVTAGKAVSSTGVPQFGMGMILLNDGVTVFPDPIGTDDAPWLWHQTGHLPPFDGGGDFGNTRFLVDVHGMRKVQGDQALFFVTSSDAAVAMSYTFGLRWGLKLS